MNANNNNVSACTIGSKEIMTPSVFIHNIRSMNFDKFDELRLVSVNYDIIFITETWLNSYKENLYRLEGFSSHFCHRKQRMGGGVGVYIRDHLSPRMIYKYSDTKVSMYWFQLHQGNLQSITYGVIYHPPGLTREEKESTTDKIISTVAKLMNKSQTNIFLCGDFNDLPTNPITHLFPLSQIVNFPTRGQNILDKIFTDLLEYISAGCQQLPPLMTNDHCALAISSTKRILTRYRSVKIHLVTPYIKNCITSDLLNASWIDLYNATCVDRKVDIFQSCLKELFLKHCPMKTIRVPIGKPIITTPLLRKLKRAKQRAYKNNSPSWKFLSVLYSKELHKESVRKTVNLINKVQRGSDSWWTEVKKVTGCQNSTFQKPFLFINDSWISAQDFTSLINDYYLDGHKDVDLSYPVILPGIVLDQVSNLEILRILDNINTKKSCISSDFPSWISKNNSHLLAEPITHIMNTMLSKRKFPSLWKDAEVRPIPKTKSPSCFKEMRPISLLYHLSKVAEKVLLRRLRSHVPLFDDQFAFTKKIGTTDALVKFSTDIVNHLDNKNVLAVEAAMLDFSKAFDKMRPDYTISKLISLGVNPSLISIIQSFFSNRRQCVRFSGFCSAYKVSRVGVPQGTILGPFLWNVFINDLKTDVDVIKYADDTTLYCPLNINNSLVVSSTSHDIVIAVQNDTLQSAIDSSVLWSDNNHMLLNAKKCNAITFSLQQKVKSRPLLVYRDHISFQNSCKLLGVVFDTHLKFSNHVDYAIDKAHKGFHALIALKRSGVSRRGLVLFHCSTIRSFFNLCSILLVSLYFIF